MPASAPSGRRHRNLSIDASYEPHVTLNSITLLILKH